MEDIFHHQLNIKHIYHHQYKMEHIYHNQLNMVTYLLSSIKHQNIFIIINGTILILIQDKLSEAVIECGMEGCTHAVLGTWPGAVCGRKGGVMVWAKAIGEMLESEEWPNLDTILWICSNFLNSWKGIKYSFCSSNGPKISIHFHI